MDPKGSGWRAEKKSIEKNRRNEMKALYTKLNSLLPHQSHSSPRGMVSLPDQLDGARRYIKTLQGKLETMKQKKERMGNLPNIDVRVSGGSEIQVVLVTGLNCEFMFNGIIRLLHQQGADVFSATFSALDSTRFHTIHAQIQHHNDSYEAARISDILRKFVYDSTVSV